MNDDQPEYIRNVLVFKPITLPWLPNKRRVITTKKVTIEDIKEETIYNENVKKLLFQLFENSLSLYLHKRFHTINTSELDEEAEEDAKNTCNFSIISALGVVFHEALGVGLLHAMSKRCDDYIKIENKPDNEKLVECKNIKTEIASVGGIATYAHVNVVMKPIRNGDLCKASCDILLLPHVIIQLPWKPSVFYQWLVAALSEILIFEKQSLELRHWCLTIGAQETATELLKLIAQFKERVTLGFMLLAKLAKSYPHTDQEIPGYIMNDVVLPSLPVLKYLITGRAHQIMKMLKKICWSNYENSDQIHFVSVQSYSLDQELDVHYSNIPYNFPLWLNNTFNHLLPTGSNTVSDIVQRLNTKSQILPDVDHVIPSCGQELALYDIFKEIYKNKETGLSNKSVRLLAIKTIKEQIVEKGKLPGLDIKVVSEKFSSEESKICADEILDESKVSNVHNALRQTLMYETACNVLHKFDDRYAITFHETIINDGVEKSSAISRIVLMQLETVQREIIVKLTQTCSIIFNIRPCLSNIQNLKVLSYDTILKNIASVHTEIKNKTYSQVLSELPSEWQKPIKYNVPLVQARYQMLLPTISHEKVAQGFENRIGILLYNIAKESPDMHLNGGEYFPHWHIVQYILPCFVAGYLVESKMQTTTLYMCSSRPYGIEGSNEVGVQNYVKFIHEYIKYYEQNYKSWLQTPPQKIITKEEEETDELKFILMMYGLIMDKTREYIRLIVNAHIYKDQRYNTGLTIFDPVLNIMYMIPFSYRAMFTCGDDCNVLFKKWYEFIFSFSNIMLVVARQAWGPPIPGSLIPECPKLGELFYANAVICELDLIFDIIRVERRYKRKTEMSCSEEMLALQAEMKEIRLETYRKVLNCKNYKTKNLESFVKEKKKKVLYFYTLLKKFYNEACPITKFCLFDKIPSNNFQPEVKNAVIFYINGNFDALDQLLTVFDLPIVKKCRKCSRMETNLIADFIVCDKCIEQKYPDVHYFCSLSCKYVYLQSNHMNEHLEFETGVSDLIKI